MVFAILRRFFDGRSLIDTFREMLSHDVPATADQYGSDPAKDVEVLRTALHERIRISRQIEIERNCFRDYLLRRGVSPTALADMVKLYDSQLKARVRAGR